MIIFDVIFANFQHAFLFEIIYTWRQSILQKWETESILDKGKDKEQRQIEYLEKNKD